MRAAAELLTMRVTEHSVKRAKQRLGLGRKAVPRMASRAWDKGVPVPKYSAGNCHLQYGSGIWVFEQLVDVVVLVTVKQARGNLCVRDGGTEAERIFCEEKHSRRERLRRASRNRRF